MNFWQSLSFTGSEDLVVLAKKAEESGFTGVSISDHLVTPMEIKSPYPYTPDGKVWWDPATHWPDPWIIASVMASHTTTLQFLTQIYVLPMHEFYGAAKGITTAAYMSNNRINLGVGVGWMKDEFDLTGQDFSTRGRRTDEMLELLEKLSTGGPIEHKGEFYSFDALTMEPHPSEKVPVLIGGESPIALARAARHDGWIGGGPYTPEHVEPLLETVHAAFAAAGRERGTYRIGVGIAAPPSLDLYKHLSDLGITEFGALPWYYSMGPDTPLQAKLDAMAQFGEEFIEPLSR